MGVMPAVAARAEAYALAWRQARSSDDRRRHSASLCQRSASPISQLRAAAKALLVSRPERNIRRSV